MTTENKMYDLIKRLSKTTGAGKTRWEKTTKRDEFLTSLSGYVVKVSQAENTLFLELVNVDGEVLEVVSSDDFGLSHDGREATRSLREVYQKARWQALGVQKAVEDMLSALGPDDDKPKAPF